MSAPPTHQLVYQCMRAEEAIGEHACKMEVTVFCSLNMEVTSSNATAFYWLEASYSRGGITQGHEYLGRQETLEPSPVHLQKGRSFPTMQFNLVNKT